MNTSGVPGTWVQAERQLGYESRLVTLYRDRRNYFEDICLNLPFIDFGGTRWLKRRVSAPDKLRVDNRVRVPETIPPIWRPHGVLERWLVRLRDRLWLPRVLRAISEYGLDRYDFYQLDGGLDFTRQPLFIPRMKERGAAVICCYTGSDLRTRGVIPQIDRLADVNVTVEFDHLILHPRIHHVFFPFDASRFVPQKRQAGGPLRIGHAPTRWAAKGSDLIVPIMNRLAATHNIEPVLIQNMPYQRAIELKAQCDIFIDQIGDLGYGINALEAIAMDIPTCTCLAAGFALKYPDHPFIEVGAANLQEQLILLIEDPERRQRIARSGRPWLERYHDPLRNVRQIHQLLMR